VYEHVLEIIAKDDSPKHKFLTPKLKSAVQEAEGYTTEVQALFVRMHHILQLKGYLQL
jgi:hypothetical protein